MMFFNNVVNYFLLFILYSIIGWIIEVTLVSIDKKQFVNRGFLIGPYCPIYGFGGILISLLLEKYSDDYIATFVLASVIASVLEYITSYLMEKLFKARWWDYSNKSFNINGRICLVNSVFFGLIGMLMLCFLTPKLVAMICNINIITRYVLASIILLIFLTDLTISFNIVSSMKHIAFEINKDSTIEISKKVREILVSKNILFRRVAVAFPNFKYTLEEKRKAIIKKKNEIVTKTRKNIEKSKEKLEDVKKEFKNK